MVQEGLKMMKDLSYANKLIKKLQLDVRGNPRTMSKGMKQKVAIVMALMNNFDIDSYWQCRSCIRKNKI